MTGRGLVIGGRGLFVFRCNGILDVLAVFLLVVVPFVGLDGGDLLVHDLAARLGQELEQGRAFLVVDRTEHANLRHVRLLPGAQVLPSRIPPGSLAQ